MVSTASQSRAMGQLQTRTGNVCSNMVPAKQRCAREPPTSTCRDGPVGTSEHARATYSTAPAFQLGQLADAVGHAAAGPVLFAALFACMQASGLLVRLGSRAPERTQCSSHALACAAVEQACRKRSGGRVGFVGFADRFHKACGAENAELRLTSRRWLCCRAHEWSPENPRKQQFAQFTLSRVQARRRGGRARGPWRPCRVPSGGRRARCSTRGSRAWPRGGGPVRA